MKFLALFLSLVLPLLAQAPQPTSVYQGTVIRVVDGDTVDVLVHLGFEISLLQRLRLLEVYAAESGEANGSDHTQTLSCLLPEGSAVTVVTNRDRTDKYGRVVAELWTGETFVNGTMRQIIGDPQGRGLGLLPSRK